MGENGARPTTTSSLSSSTKTITTFVDQSTSSVVTSTTVSTLVVSKSTVLNTVGSTTIEDTTTTNEKGECKLSGDECVSAHGAGKCNENLECVSLQTKCERIGNNWFVLF